MMRRALLSSTATVFYVLIGVLLVGTVLAAVTGRNFFSAGNLTTILTATTVLGLVAIGQTLVILVGSLDLSIPFLVSIASVLGAGVMGGTSAGLIPGILTAVISATMLGLANGVLVGVLRINGFIATLGVGLIVSGYLLTYYRGSSGKASPELLHLGAFTLGPFPVVTLIMLVCLVLAALFLARTRAGMHVYAVGGDSSVARLSGVHNWLPIIIVHAVSGLLCGLAGLVLVARLGVGSPTLGSQGGYDLLSIAAVVLGGTALAGGRGSLWGTLGGILIFASIDSVLGVLEVNPYLKDVVRGIVIIGAVALYARRSSVSRAIRFPSANLVAGASRPEVD
jgi:ribose transport system permease protein